MARPNVHSFLLYITRLVIVDINVVIQCILSSTWLMNTENTNIGSIMNLKTNLVLLGPGDMLSMCSF